MRLTVTAFFSVVSAAFILLGTAEDVTTAEDWCAESIPLIERGCQHFGPHSTACVVLRKSGSHCRKVAAPSLDEGSVRPASENVLDSAPDKYESFKALGDIADQITAISSGPKGERSLQSCLSYLRTQKQKLLSSLRVRSKKRSQRKTRQRRTRKARKKTNKTKRGTKKTNYKKQTKRCTATWSKNGDVPGNAPEGLGYRCESKDPQGGEPAKCDKLFKSGLAKRCNACRKKGCMMIHQRKGSWEVLPNGHQKGGRSLPYSAKCKDCRRKCAIDFNNIGRLSESAVAIIIQGMRILGQGCSFLRTPNRAGLKKLYPAGMCRKGSYHKKRVGEGEGMDTKDRKSVV